MRLILPAAAMIGAASLLASMDAMAQCTRTSIPLPNRTLLKPPSELDCEFKAPSPDVTGQPQPNATSGQTNPAADAAALVMKLDYERQCYRHAGMILRDSLRQLQASVDETVKAVSRTCPAISSDGAGSRTSIPVPAQALLAPPPEFGCEFKDNSPNDAGVAPQPSPTSTQADAALRMKLDYERQCYRHAEMILRNGLRELQASVGETIKAVNREQPPARQQRLADRELAHALQAGGFVIVHRYTGRMPAALPPAPARTIDAGQRISPQGYADAQAMGEVYRRLKIPVAEVLSSEYFLVYQTATAAFGNRVKLHRDLTGSRSFQDPSELERSLSGLRSRVAKPPPTHTNVVLWTHEGKFKKAFGSSLPAGETVVFGRRSDGAAYQVARLSLKEFLALTD